MIEHLICEGGYSVFYKQINILNNLRRKKLLDNVKTITGYSAGVITGLLYCLNIDDTNYLKIFENIKIFDYKQYLLSVFLKKNSIYDFINNLLEPFFKLKNISMDISLIDFYKITNIELKIIGFRKNIETNESEDCYFSYMNHPTLKLIDAIALSISQKVDIINLKKITYENYIYQDTPFKIKYVSFLFKNYENDSILYLGIRNNDRLLNIENIDPTSYFENCIFYKRNYIVNNNIKNILDVILKNEFFKNELIKNFQINNLNVSVMNYNNCIEEIKESILFIMDKDYRIELWNIINNEFENYNLT